MSKSKSRLARISEILQRDTQRLAEESEERAIRRLAYMVEPTPLILFPDQEIHVARDQEIYEISPIARDPSSTGLGKTECYFALAYKLGLALWIVCPAHMIESVKKRHRKYNENVGELVFVFSYYDAMNDVKMNNEGREASYKLTIGNKKKGFHIANDFREAVKGNEDKKGILLVFDEHHLTKNRDSARSKATGELIRYIVEEYRKANDENRRDQFHSRIYLCSATHIDKKSQTLNLLINFGIVDGKLIQGSGANKDIRNYMALLEEAIRLAGFKDIKGNEGYKLLRRLNAKHKNLIFNESVSGEFTPKRPNNVVEASADEIMYDIARLVILPLITSEMTPFIPRLTFNAFFDFTTRESEELYINSLMKMMSAAHADRKVRLAYLGQGLRASQQACIPTCVDFLVSLLKRNPNQKVYLVARYLGDNLDLAKDLFEEAGYSVLFMSGKTTMPKRDEILFKFQQQNNTHRVLLFTTALASGFDAHDLSGEFPRDGIILRDYSPSDIDQAAGRLFRRMMKSFGNCYVFNSIRYGGIFRRITEILTDKSQVLKEVSLDVFKKGLERNFPGFYPRCFINGYTIEGKGKEAKRHDILYLNEYNFKDSEGYRIDDEELVRKFIKGEKLPLVDAPLSYLLDADGNKRAVDDTFEGLNGIFGLHTYTTEEPMSYKKSLGSDANPFDEEQVAERIQIFNNIMSEIEEMKKENKKDVVANLGEDDDLDDDLNDLNDLVIDDENYDEDYEGRYEVISEEDSAEAISEEDSYEEVATDEESVAEEEEDSSADASGEEASTEEVSDEEVSDEEVSDDDTGV